MHLAEWPTLYAVASTQVFDEGFADAEVLGRGRQGQMKVACQLLLWNRWDSRGHSKSRAGTVFRTAVLSPYLLNGINGRDG